MPLRSSNPAALREFPAAVQIIREIASSDVS